MNTQEPVAGYAYWISPDGSSKVIYSLDVFREIDDTVSEGFRRIPHGGVETGGLLFGTRNAGGLRIDAQRPIQCQHAFGPSFVLSDDDLVALREQITTAGSDADLAGLVPVGWFVSHTRSSLQMNAREAVWFDEFFPAPGSLTLLVKPERFHPTRFTFLLRNQAGGVEQDESQPAVILPLTGQGPAAGSAPSPSIAAPKTAPRPVAGPIVYPAPAVSNPAPSEPTRVRTPSPPAGPVPTLRERDLPEPVYQPQPEIAYPYASLADGRTRTTRAKAGGFGLKSAAVLVLAAVLGCVAGYWAYLQLPSPVIPVSVREQGTRLVVEWPSTQTDNVEYAALQVNDGQWVTLTSEQKANGRAVVDVPSGDLKIDILAKHFLRDSRGIVRYIRNPRPVR